MTEKFADYSSNNPLPDIAKYKATGRTAIALKATESTNYVWDASKALANTAREAGLEVWSYHFARPGSSGVAQANFFLNNFNHKDTPVLDLEGAGWAVGEAEKVCADFCNQVRTVLGRTGVIYTGAYFRPAMKWPDGWKWWVPAYGQDAPPKTPKGWPDPTAWQYTNNAVINGAHVDDSVFLTNSGELTMADIQTLLAAIAELRKDMDQSFAAVHDNFDSMGNTLLGKLDANGQPVDKNHLSNAVVIAEIRKAKA